MSDITKTFAFVATAAALVGLAVANHFANRPKTNVDFERVGTPFFEEFTSSEQAASLEVSAVDPDNLTLKQFIVENENGVWRIPSHHGYPAEAAERLAKTAASVIGVERETLAGRLAAEHEKLGVVDPLGEDMEDPESAGKRITLKNPDGDVLVDLIIGKSAGAAQLKESTQDFGNERPADEFYYVRRPDEQQTYKVKLDIDLSTRFSDWIDPDLLRLDPAQLVRLDIDNYTLSEDPSSLGGGPRALLKVQSDLFRLTRASSTEPWVLSDLETTAETLNPPRINEMIASLGELQIVGVRPKTKYKNHSILTADLKLNQRPEFKENPAEFQLALDKFLNQLEDNGFSLAGTNEKLELVSQFGQLQAGIQDGVLYTMQFGKLVEGEESEIEIGGGASSESSDSTDQGESEAADENSSGTSNGDEAESETQSDAEKNRYLMIRVSFDETLLGERPAKPNEPAAPVKPAGYVPVLPETETENKAETGDDDRTEAPDSDAATEENEDGAEDTTTDDAETPDEKDKPERDPQFTQYDEAMDAYEQQKIEYEIALSRYENDRTAFETLVTEGKKRVEELNQRFGDWFYVIRANNLQDLQTPRSELVTPIEPPAEAAADAAAESTPVSTEPEEDMPQQPDISFPKPPEDEE
jgi:hypothetical protein